MVNIMKWNTFFKSLAFICVGTATLFGCNTSKPASEPNKNEQNQITPAQNDQHELTRPGIVRLNEYVNDGFAPQDVQNNIRSCFNDFKTAVGTYQGKTAADMMSDSSLEYYQNVLLAARTAIHNPNDYQVLSKKFPPSVKTLSTILTKRMSAEFIDSATPLQLYETGFSQGWIGYKSIASASLDNIIAYHKDNQKYYTADFYYEHTVDDGYVMSIGFVFQNDKCRIDLVPLFSGIDQVIEKYIDKKNLNPDEMFENTMETSESALDPNNWPPYPAEQDNFVAYFPKTPISSKTVSEHVYTALDHRFGQFTVVVTYYTPGEDTPYYQKSLRDQAIMSFLTPIHAEKPACTAGMINRDTLIKCDFTISAQDAKGKAVWVFSNDRQYLITNIARSNQFKDEVASQFIEKFNYFPNSPNPS